jgi:hypothetical protein
MRPTLLYATRKRFGVAEAADWQKKPWGAQQQTANRINILRRA